MQHEVRTRIVCNNFDEFDGKSNTKSCSGEDKGLLILFGDDQYKSCNKAKAVKSVFVSTDAQKARCKEAKGGVKVLCDG